MSGIAEIYELNIITVFTISSYFYTIPKPGQELETTVIWN